MIRMMSLEEAIMILGNPCRSGIDFHEYCSALKQCFRDLIKQFHADKTDKVEYGRQIIEAYSVIKDALEQGDLQTLFYGHSNAFYGHSHPFTSTDDEIFDSELYENLSIITEFLVATAGKMKDLLSSLSAGEHNLCFHGFRFKVTCFIEPERLHQDKDEEGKVVFERKLPENRFWQVHTSSMVKFKEIAPGPLPLAVLIHKGEV